MKRIKLSQLPLIMIGILPLATQQTLAEAFNVPDAALQKCLIEIVSTKQWQTPQEFTEIKCHSEGVKSLAGLEPFTNIEMLSIYNNQLERIDIDLAKLPKLKTLNLARNKLKHVSLTDLDALEKLYLFDNGMTSLRLANLPQLEVLKTNNNEIESFSYDNMPKLKKIYIFNNELETINIHDLPTLQYMDCRENPMPDELYDEMDQMVDITFLHDGNAEDW